MKNKTMGITTQYFLLWLLASFTSSTQELLTLKVRPKISAECGKHVILDCEVSSSQHGLSIKHMEWYQSSTSFCAINSEEVVITNPEHAANGINCTYQQGKLSLIIKNINPMNSGDSKTFGCKLRSNKGTREESTTVELQENCGQVIGVMNNAGPTCNFTHVYPDGEVHWFQGPRRLHGHQTTERVDKEGWLVIHSSLEQDSSESVYNCSLWSPKTNRYITSTLVANNLGMIKTRCSRCGAGSQRPTWTVLIVTLLLAVALK